MPSARPAEPVRVVIDESSFDFRDQDTADVERHLDEFNDAVWDLREEGIVSWCPPMLEAAPCLDGLELFEYLVSVPGNSIDRDTRNRFFGLIAKCPEWEEPQPASADVSLAGATSAIALSAAYALTLALAGHSAACLVFGACSRRGFTKAASKAGEAELFFFAAVRELREFWRSLYELENISETDFFGMAGRAFPSLVFHPGLTFRRFEGSYRELRPAVVQHLTVLNDHFMVAHREANGVASDIEATLTPLGCAGISPESPNVHRKGKAMAQHDVEYEGSVVRCEWHTKVEKHRNRIHFAFGDPFGEMIFVGMFVDHLDL